jgi:hypothetical protein
MMEATLLLMVDIETASGVKDVLHSVDHAVYGRAMSWV